MTVRAERKDRGAKSNSSKASDGASRRAHLGVFAQPGDVAAVGLFTVDKRLHHLDKRAAREN